MTSQNPPSTREREPEREPEPEPEREPERGGSTCARKPDGTLWCWGNNGKGQLGDGTTTERDTPVQW